MKRHKVYLIEEAEQDLLDLHRYVSANDSSAKADSLIDRLENVCESLSTLPDRGHVPPELSRVGVTQFREIRFKPYRIFYEAEDRKVLVHAILDGRRDLQDVLQERLIREGS